MNFSSAQNANLQTLPFGILPRALFNGFQLQPLGSKQKPKIQPGPPKPAGQVAWGQGRSLPAHVLRAFLQAATNHWDSFPLFLLPLSLSRSTPTACPLKYLHEVGTRMVTGAEPRLEMGVKVAPTP